MGDEFLGIDDEVDTRQVSNMNISDTTGKNLQATPTCASKEVKAVESKKKGVEVGGGSQIIPIVSDKGPRLNTVKGQCTNYNFFRIHRTKISLIILIVIFIVIVIVFGLGMTSSQQEASNKKKNETGIVCL